MPAKGHFDAKVKFELSQVDSLPTSNDTSVIEMLNGSMNGWATVWASNKNDPVDDNDKKKFPAVVIKPGSFQLNRLFAIRPVSVFLVEQPKEDKSEKGAKGDKDSKPIELIESELDPVIRRDELASCLQFSVEEIKDGTSHNDGKWYGIGRMQVYCDGMVDRLLGGRESAQLRFRFDPIKKLLTEDAAEKYSAVKKIVVQVIGAYSTESQKKAKDSDDQENEKDNDQEQKDDRGRANV